MKLYLLLINLLSFALYGIDKHKAQKHAYRIPEKVLILSTVLGGGIGALLGMHVFHHKTRKPLFYIGVPVILVLEICIAVYVIQKGIL
ncbi:MAG: DUF1294 domain-containing protein [Bulleidia sp.]|nr:DUF1294 domain-containing protein [Bulleidia sp.]